MIKAIIFDCFGVLLEDALHGIVDQLNDSSKKVEILKIVRSSSKGSLSPDESRKKIADLLGITVAEFSRLMNEGEVKNTKLFDYILGLRKKYKTGILSNIRPGGLESRFSESELKKHFDVVIGSGDIGYIKPETKAYEITADSLGVKLNECVVVDDKQPYCDAARALGMEAVLYRTFSQMKSDLENILDK